MKCNSAWFKHNDIANAQDCEQQSLTQGRSVSARLAWCDATLTMLDHVERAGCNKHERREVRRAREVTLRRMLRLRGDYAKVVAS